MKKVLITGAAGFIGSHLTDAYLREGWSVVGIDDLSTGRLENLDLARTSDRFAFVCADIAKDEDALASAMRGSDRIVHLAARIGLKLVIESPLKTLETNVQGTETVLRHATTAATPTIIASTSEVYGATTKFPSSESDSVAFGSPEKGRWSYACSKAYDESLALAYHRERGLPATIVRLFNTVGPRQSSRYGMVIPRFVRQALAGEPMTVYGDGTQTRCFCHVGEVVDALVLLGGHTESVGQILNLGNPHEISIVALAEKVRLLTPSSSPIAHVPFDVAYGDGFEEIVRRVPDITKIRAAIGFEPHRTIDDIISDVVEEQHRLQATLV